MKPIDHIALVVDAPGDAARWYEAEFEASILYMDDTWAMVAFENIKMAFVLRGTHPAHFAMKVEQFSKEDTVKPHRDGSQSVYKRDPWGNIFELISYEKPSR